MRHPESARLSSSIRSRYRTSFPTAGYHVERRRFGFYTRNSSCPDFARIIVAGATAAAVPELLADAGSYFGAESVDIWLEDENDELAATEFQIASAIQPLHAGGVHI